METQADLFHAQLKDALDQVSQEAQALSPTLAPEPLQISTMTIFTVLNYKVDLPELERLWSSPTLQQQRSATLPDVRLKSTTGTNFYNCLVFSIGNNKRKPVVKVFCNGNLHITGVQTMHDALTLSRSFCTLFDHLIDLDTEQEGYRVEAIDIQLINSYFKISPQISLPRLFSALIRDTQHLTLFNNDHHAGVIVKWVPPNQPTRKVSIILFDTGNILISAFLSGPELVEAYRFITSFLRERQQEVCVSSTQDGSSRPTKRPKMTPEFDYRKYIVLK